MTDKPLTATEVRHLQYEFFTNPEVIRTAEAIGRIQGELLDRLIDRIKQCQKPN